MMLLALAVLFLPGAVGINTAVVPAPSVKEKRFFTEKVVLMKTTTQLIVNGANFKPEYTKLLFDPPLQRGFHQEVISSTAIRITKHFNYDVWAAEPGPLTVVAIDTGAGLVHLNPEEGGVVVAAVQAERSSHYGTTIQINTSLRVYQSTRQIKVIGTGFQDNTKLRFTTALRGPGTNFTITDILPDQFTLNLAEGSTWIKDPNTLPRDLVMLAADAGHGWVQLGKPPFHQGGIVAYVFEDPSIEASDFQIYRNHTRELLITGANFVAAKTSVLFSPPINLHDVVGQVVNRTTIRMTLATTSDDWTDALKYLGGPLTIKGIDTGAGMVRFDSPVTVATIMPIFAASEENGAQVA